MPSISAGSTTDKRKISPTTYETVTQGSSIKPRTEHEELMRYIPHPLQRLIEKIDNPPKDGDCGYTCVAWSSGKCRGISTPELIRKHLSAELKKDKKTYEMIEGRKIDEDIRNTQAGKSSGVAGWLKMPLFGYAIANHLRRPLYYFSLDSMHTYLPTSSSYSGYPPFCMAFAPEIKALLINWLLEEPGLPLDNLQHQLDFYEKPGLEQILKDNQVELITELLNSNANLFLDEIWWGGGAIYEASGISCNNSTMNTVLNQYMGYTLKITSKIHINQSDVAREDYMYHITKYPARFLVFTDESGVCLKTLMQRAGLTPCAISLGRLLACHVSEENLLSMNPFPGPNSALVMDNAEIHKGYKVEQLFNMH
ncbi:hypothetical protein BY996DRAFT_8335809, partial [Phakopsora pachyrhizi]